MPTRYWLPVTVGAVLLVFALTTLAVFAFHIPGLSVPVSTWKVPF